MSLFHLREHYDRDELLESTCAADPVEQFRAWLEAALEANIPDANAMALATVDARGCPSNRMVLLKDVTPAGFTFFTNHASGKGRDLAHNPHASLLFFWAALHRQARIDGVVTMLPREESEAYFRTRPYLSRIGALASRQSEPIADRAALEAIFEALQHKHPEGTEVPMPATWGGYRLAHTVVEFWQGRPGRLHDRLRYTRADDRWRIERLQP